MQETGVPILRWKVMQSSQCPWREQSRVQGQGGSSFMLSGMDFSQSNES
jgi:hypothetical protein